MAVKGTPTCHWCKDEIVGHSPYGASANGIVTYPGVLITVCGPGCKARPEGEPCYRRDFGQLTLAG